MALSAFNIEFQRIKIHILKNLLYTMQFLITYSLSLPLSLPICSLSNKYSISVSSLKLYTTHQTVECPPLSLRKNQYLMYINSRSQQFSNLYNVRSIYARFKFFSPYSFFRTLIFFCPPPPPEIFFPTTREVGYSIIQELGQLVANSTFLLSRFNTRE